MATLRRIDHIVLTGIGLLVVFTPLCFGSVHPWAYSLMEQLGFLLIIAWLGKAWIDGGRLLRRGGRAAAAAVVAPLVMLLGFLALETVPLPPALLASLSPAAYHLYARVLPGWPFQQPYRDVDFNASPTPPAAPVILPTVQQVRAGISVPFEPPTSSAPNRSAIASDDASRNGVVAVTQRRGMDLNGRKKKAAEAPASHSPANAPPIRATVVSPPGARSTRDISGAYRASGAYRTKSRFDATGFRALSFEPAVTRAGLLKALAYAAIFLLVALYPFGAPGEARSEEHFCRAVLTMVLVTGLGIAFVGLVNWASWNGKILWFFVPLDWGAPQIGMMLRASGPFVNPDHFANYLAMIFPFALAGALFRTDLVQRRWSTALRLGSVLVAFLIVCALLLSLSRGGWAAAAFGAALLIAMYLLQPEERRAVFSRRGDARTLRWAGAGMLGLVVLALMFIGPQGRSLTTARLGQTAADSMTMADRTVLWRGSLAMIRDFPLFGVGLGAWGELFTRYAPTPWSPYFFYRDAHNDYLQFIAEAGLLAMLLLLWLGWRILHRLATALRTGNPRKWPLLAAVVAAVAAMALHETVDFSLQVPANAVLLAILLGLGLRAATPPAPGDEMRRGRVPRLALALLAGTALLLIFAATGQRDVYYPEFLPQVKTLRGAVARVNEHAADSEGHLILARLGRGILTSQARLREIRSAVWLDPTNPEGRDAYASLLAQRGNLKLAEAEVTRSIFNSPSTDTHFYLSRELVHWLAPPTRVAVERGFREAIAAGISGALRGLGDFYALRNQPLKEAQLEAEAGSRSKDATRRLRLLLGAGQAYAVAGYMLSAEAMFRTAMEEAPADTDPYLDLVRTVYGPDRDMRSARAVIDEAIRAGHDAYRLNLELAGAASQARDATTQEKALKDALAEIPEDTNGLIELGEFYLDRGRYDDALLTFEKADDAQPDSARIRFDLGRSQELTYHYYDAEKSYAHAVVLAPENRAWAEYYADFKRRMIEESARIDKAATSQPGTGTQPAAAPTPATED